MVFIKDRIYPKNTYSIFLCFFFIRFVLSYNFNCNFYFHYKSFLFFSFLIFIFKQFIYFFFMKFIWNYFSTIFIVFFIESSIFSFPSSFCSFWIYQCSCICSSMFICAFQDNNPLFISHIFMWIAFLTFLLALYTKHNRLSTPFLQVFIYKPTCPVLFFLA